MAEFKNMVINIFGAVLGGMFAFAIVGLVAALTVFCGFSIVKRYNKPGTKLFRDMTFGQYIGAIIMIIGLAPFMQFFFQGFLFSAGHSAFSSISNEF